MEENQNLEVTSNLSGQTEQVNEPIQENVTQDVTQNVTMDETQKIFQLFGLPVFQSLAQVITPDAAAELLKWTMNRLNLQGTEQVTEMLNMNNQLRQFAEQTGIPGKEFQAYQNDLMSYIQKNIPQLSIDLANRKSQQPPM